MIPIKQYISTDGIVYEIYKNRIASSIIGDTHDYYSHIPEISDIKQAKDL